MKATLILSLLFLSNFTFTISKEAALNNEEQASGILQSSDFLYNSIPPIADDVSEHYFNFVEMNSQNWEGAYTRFKPSEGLYDSQGCHQYNPKAKNATTNYKNFMIKNEILTFTETTLEYNAHGCFGWWIKGVQFTASGDFTLKENLVSTDKFGFDYICNDNDDTSFKKCSVNGSKNQEKSFKDYQALMMIEGRGWLIREFINNLVSRAPWKLSESEKEISMVDH